MTKNNKRAAARQLRQEIKENTYALVETYCIYGNDKLNELTKWSNNCYNELMYLMRRHYFKRSKKFKRQIKAYKRGRIKTFPKWPDDYSDTKLKDILKLQSKNKQSTLFDECPDQHILQDLIKAVKQNWTDYYAAKADYNKKPYKYLGRPNIPGYLPKGKRHSIEINNQTLHLSKRKDYIINQHFGINIPISDNFKLALTNPANDPHIAKLSRESILRTCWVKPIKNNGVKICATYVVTKKPRNTYKGKAVPKRNPNIFVAGDPGVDNLLALVTNNIDFKPLIINGKGIKSVNHYYNKTHALLQAKATKYKQKGFTKHKKDGTTQIIYHTGKKAELLDAWRDRKLTDAIHKATDRVLEYAINCGASKIIIGRNKYWKQKSSMSKQNNQNFVGIPHYKVINMLKYKALLYGIEVISQPESYTSQTSFLDGEAPVWRNGNKARKKHGKSPINRRLKRGLFVTNQGYRINADINGTLQIAHKYDKNNNLNVFCKSDGQKVSLKQIIECVLHPIKWSPVF